MATAEVTPSPQPQVNSAQMSGPGTAEARWERNPVLPSQEISSGLFPPSNMQVSVEFLDPGQRPNPRPAQVLLGALGDPRLQVVQPISLDVSVEESHVIVSWSAVDEFGTGDTLSAAIDDFSAAVRELYHQLFAPDANLGSDLQRVKQTLAQSIMPRK
jgi:hypothetical protein